MSTYAIGDVQGCFDELQVLLQHIQFDANKDVLWFTGDLVNRGPQSLEVLRFVKSLGDKHITVLGNHDLHLLAVMHGSAKLKAEDTLDAVLQAPDKQEFMQWLLHRPLLHADKSLGYVMVHAGIAPMWSLQQAQQLAAEVQAVLQDEKRVAYFFQHMYGNQPDYWQDDLLGVERWRCIVNYFTRMRFCNQQGHLDLTYKGEIAGKPVHLIPWFELPNRLRIDEKIIFGHWAALNGHTDDATILALDTGCVWGNALSALRLEDGKHFQIKCQGWRHV